MSKAGSAENISKIQADITKYRDKLLTGYVLAVDPSAGSGSSLPGYAIFRAGELVESGVIQVKVSAAKNKRLYEIRSSLEHDFEVPDVLVLEHISGYAFGPLRYNINAFAGLHRGVGAILSAFNVDAVIEVPPIVWKKYIDEGYEKTDEMDAIYIGRYVINSAAGNLGDTSYWEESRVVKPRKPRRKKVPGKAAAKKKKKKTKKVTKS